MHKNQRLAAIYLLFRYIFEKLMMRDEPRRKDERADISVFIASQFQLVPTVGITPPPPRTIFGGFNLIFFFLRLLTPLKFLNSFVVVFLPLCS